MNFTIKVARSVHLTRATRCSILDLSVFVKQVSGKRRALKLYIDFCNLTLKNVTPESSSASFGIEILIWEKDPAIAFIMGLNYANTSVAPVFS